MKERKMNSSFLHPLVNVIITFHQSSHPINYIEQRTATAPAVLLHLCGSKEISSSIFIGKSCVMC